MICKNCNLDLFPNIKKVGPHTGAYCSFCGKWIKWLNKTEASIYLDDKFKGNAIKVEVKEIEINTENKGDSEVPW